jgi:choline kinase
MKAVILAAGRGVRMGKYTENLPKCMLSFNGKTLLEWQMRALRRAGVNRIIICTGYQRDAIPYEDVKYYHNHDYSTTNMVETLMCAREEFDTDVIVSYADILYNSILVRQVALAPGTVAVAVDSAWRSYWMMRFGSTECDLETLTVHNGRIVELGEEAKSSAGIWHRYIGLMKFSQDAWTEVFSLYDYKKTVRQRWHKSGRDFRNGYMTDLLNELIERGVEIVPCISKKQWMEFDSERDYEIACQYLARGRLSEVFSFED